MQLLQVNATPLYAREGGFRFSVRPSGSIRVRGSSMIRRIGFSSTYMNALYQHGAERAQGNGALLDERIGKNGRRRSSTDP